MTGLAGDMAPTGLFIAPFGESSFEELVAIYTEQAAALAAAGVDLFLIETTMTMPEARAAVLACKSVSDRPVWVTFTCDENGRTLSGTDVLAALIVMQGMGVDAFGLNCSSGPAEMLEQMRRLRQFRVSGACLKNVNMPEQRAFFRHTALIFLAIHKVLLRQIALSGEKIPRRWAHFHALNKA